MNNSIMVVALALTGCASLQSAQSPRLVDTDCTQDCELRLQQCPQVFAAFPERGAIECPAAHEGCLKSCAAQQGSVARAPAMAAPPAPVSAPASKEAKLRELKRLHDQGLISDDVYVDRQKAILSEP